MGTIKPTKIKLSQGDKRAQGMYLLIDSSEEKYTKDGITRPPNRDYNIQIAVETIYNSKRCRGKRNFLIQKGTSIIKAVESLIPKRNDMIQTLKGKGTLKIEKLKFYNISNDKDTVLNNLFEKFIMKKKINSKPNTVRVYITNYNTHIKPYIGNYKIENIDEDVIQEKVFYQAMNKNKAANTIAGLKRVLKPLLDQNNKILNWKNIEVPKPVTGKRKYNKSQEETKKIIDALISYYHPIAQGVFEFLLMGRRLNETLYLHHEQVNYETNTFTILAKYSKTKKDLTFNLTPRLIKAIKNQKTSSGRIFKLESRQMLEHFKNAMRSIKVYDMVLHDIRSMVAQTSLDNGADIYEVSKMLGHQKVATTEASYAEGGAKQALKAQKIFEDKYLINDNIIDVDIIDQTTDKFSQIKKLYPNVNEKIIQYAIDILEGKVIP